MNNLLFCLTLALASLLARMEIPGFYGGNEGHPVPCPDCRATGDLHKEKGGLLTRGSGRNRYVGEITSKKERSKVTCVYRYGGSK